MDVAILPTKKQVDDDENDDDSSSNESDDAWVFDAEHGVLFKHQKMDPRMYPNKVTFATKRGEYKFYKMDISRYTTKFNLECAVKCFCNIFSCVNICFAYVFTFFCKVSFYPVLPHSTALQTRSSTFACAHVYHRLLC